MSRFLTMFQQAVALYGGIRPTARLLGVSAPTISRINRGDELDPRTAAVLGPAVGVCPCCQQDWPAAVEQTP